MRTLCGTILAAAVAFAVNVCLADVSNVDSRYFADYDPSTSTVTGA